MKIKYLNRLTFKGASETIQQQSAKRAKTVSYNKISEYFAMMGGGLTRVHDDVIR